MFCPKCGSSINESDVICPNCSFNINNIKNDNQICEGKIDSAHIPDTTERGATSLNMVSSLKATIFTILAIAVLFFFFIASNKIAEGSLGIMEIQSVGGKTLEEAYYFELGTIYEGYSLIAKALGIFLSSVLVWIGFKK